MLSKRWPHVGQLFDKFDKCGDCLFSPSLNMFPNIDQTLNKCCQKKTTALERHARAGSSVAKGAERSAASQASMLAAAEGVRPTEKRTGPG